jgi:hypothetical protein
MKLLQVMVGIKEPQKDRGQVGMTLSLAPNLPLLLLVQVLLLVPRDNSTMHLKVDNSLRLRKGRERQVKIKLLNRHVMYRLTVKQL